MNMEDVKLTAVVQAFMQAVQRSDILVDNAILVPRAVKVVAETTARSIKAVVASIRSNARLAVCRKFRLEGHGSTDGCHIWATGRDRKSVV